MGILIHRNTGVTASRSTGAENNLLGRLEPDDFASVSPALAEWDAAAGQVIYEPGDAVRWTFFPRGASLVSFRVGLSDGRMVEAALVGREGAVGGVISHGKLPSFSQSVVQFAGPFWRIESARLDAAKQAHPRLDNLLSRYADCLMAQVFQSAACNAAHPIERRIARWLVSAFDRTGDPRLPVTQEELAASLGVGRSYVSQMLKSLSEQGALEPQRGVVRLLDVERLRQLACECEAAVRTHFEDVLANVYPGEKAAAGG